MKGLLFIVLLILFFIVGVELEQYAISNIQTKRMLELNMVKYDSKTGELIYLDENIKYVITGE